MAERNLFIMSAGENADVAQPIIIAVGPGRRAEQQQGQIPGTPIPLVPEPPQPQIAQPSQATFQKKVKVVRAMRKFAAEVQHFDTEAAVSFLNIKFYGQRITNRYRAQCAAILWDELDRRGIHNVHRKLYITYAVEEHIRQKLEEEPRWTYDMVQKANCYNNALEGRIEKRNPWWFWITDVVQINTGITFRTSSREDNKFKSHVVAPVMIALAAGVMATAGFLGYRLAK